MRKTHVTKVAYDLSKADVENAVVYWMLNIHNITPCADTSSVTINEDGTARFIEGETEHKVASKRPPDPAVPPLNQAQAG